MLVGYSEMRPNGYIIQMGYRLLLWYIKKCIFTTVIGGTFYQYLHSLKEKCNMKTIRKKFQNVHLAKRGSSYIRVNTVMSSQ